MTSGHQTKPPARPELGSDFGPYRVEALLGEGGMGRVYRARDTRGGTVALKVMRSERSIDETLRRRFRREARAAARVDHPHVVPLLDVGDVDGAPYLAQRFMEGGTLDARICRDGALPLRDVVALCLDVAAGLDAIHAEGLVHRDLKPANILLDADGRALVGDLGLCKLTDASVLTRPGQAVGSMDYMAPEQIRGHEPAPAVDVYALGCVVFECLAGAPPFADRQGMQVLWAHLRDEPPDPCAGRDDAPAGLAWAVLSALAKDPGERPPSATGYAQMVSIAASVGTAPPGRRR
jgi:serine/threonine protein kinase